MNETQKQIEALLKTMSDTQLAATVGVSSAAVFRWKKGTRPHATFRKKIEEMHKRIILKGGKA